jgi:hypothetical protein
VRRWLLAAAALLGLFAAVTVWALESGGVAVVETRDAGGAARRTHVWFVEAEGELWLEAGTPENPWYRDVLRDPALVLEVADRRERYRAQPVPGETARARIRRLLREKYGLRDAWVGLLVDTSRSVAVRLLPDAAG